MDRIFDVLAAITTVALVTTLVSNRNTSRVIAASGKAYSESLRAAMGR
jgi:uncharacterized membrane protein